jgi:hypothetical protein
MQSGRNLENVTERDNRNERAYYEAAAALRERQVQGKERMRKRLAALSFSGKIKILEKLRGREKAIAASGLRQKPTKN